MQETTSFEALFDPGNAADFFQIDNLPAFDPAATTAYLRGNALWLVEICRLVYRQDAPSRREFFRRRAGLEEIRFFDQQATQGALLSGKNFAVLAFRGTLGLRDWLADFDFPPVPWRGEGRVHQGFKDQLDPVWEDVKAELNKINVPVFYTGHSLGAALATLTAASRFLDGGAPPAALYSFGSPRVGTTRFMQAFPSGFLHCRVSNDRDIVPTVPPPALGLLTGSPFHHVGIPHHIERDGRLRRGKLNQDDGITGPFAELFEGFAFWRDKLAEILESKGASLTEKLTDHAPVNYTARIEKA